LFPTLNILIRLPLFFLFDLPWTFCGVPLPIPQSETDAKLLAVRPPDSGSVHLSSYSCAVCWKCFSPSSFSSRRGIVRFVAFFTCFLRLLSITGISGFPPLGRTHFLFPFPPYFFPPSNFPTHPSDLHHNSCNPPPEGPGKMGLTIPFSPSFFWFSRALFPLSSGPGHCAYGIPQFLISQDSFEELFMAGRKQTLFFPFGHRYLDEITQVVLFSFPIFPLASRLKPVLH